MKLTIESFLKSHPNWEELLSAAPYNLVIKRDGEYVLFKYNQYESDMSERICQEARGIIFHEPTLTPVCVPFFKFFNYGEPNAAGLDWEKTVTVTEKIDGSLMKLWFHNEEWHLSTNGIIDAYKAYVGDRDATFGQLFEESLGVSMQELLEHADPNMTYMFELVHPDNETIIRYNCHKVYLLAQRNMTTYEEQDDILYLPGTWYPKKYNLDKIDDILTVVNQMNEDHEGVVVCDILHNRIKVKSTDYLLRAKAYNNGVITDKRIIKMYRADILDDFLAYAPSKREQVDEVLYMLNAYIERQNNIYDKIKDVSDRKSFAQQANAANGDVAYLMARYDNRLTQPFDYFKSYLYVPSVLRILEQERERKEHQDV